MSPRDRALAGLLAELGAYVLPPIAAYVPGDPDNARRAEDEQRSRAVRAKQVLGWVAEDVCLRPAADQAESFARYQRIISSYAAEEPLPYVPYEPEPEPAL